MASDELVHDADAGSNKFVLGLAAELRYLGEGNIGVIETAERECRSDFKGGGRAQAGTDWDLSVDEQVRAREFLSTLLKGVSYSQRIVAPGSCPALGQMVDIELKVTGKLL